MQAGEQAAEHNRGRAAGKRLGDVAAVADSAVGDQGHAGGCRGPGAGGYRGELGHARARDDTGCTDRSGAHTYFDHVGAGLCQHVDALGCYYISGNNWKLGEASARRSDGFENALRMAVGSVDGKRVCSGVYEAFGAAHCVSADANCAGHEEASALVFGRVGEVLPLQNIFIGYQSLEVTALVDKRQLFDSITVKDLLGFFERRAQLGGDEILGHHVLGDRALVGPLQNGRRGWSGFPEAAYRHR